MRQRCGLVADCATHTSDTALGGRTERVGKTPLGQHRLSYGPTDSSLCRAAMHDVEGRSRVLH